MFQFATEICNLHQTEPFTTMSIALEKVIVSNPTTKRAFSTHLSYDKTRDRVIYPSGKCVVLRSLGDGEDWVFNEHKYPVTVAKISPSGFYVASGDEAGNVLIWDCSQPEMILKSEFKILSNKINDLAWDADSKRIIAVGNGSDKYGHCFTFDSGNSIGEISGHSAQINSVAIKPTRPYSAFTVGDDSNVVFYKGPPFKFNQSNKSAHTNFIKMVKYSPDGKIVATVGVDRIVSLFDGNTGELTTTFKNLSNGGIYGLDWVDDSKFIIAGADAYLRLVNIDGSIIKEWNLPYKVENQFLGCCVAGDKYIAITLGEQLYVYHGDEVNVIDAHQVAITALLNTSTGLYTGSFDGKIIKHAKDDVLIQGEAHQSLVVSIKESDGKIFSVSWDDELNIINGNLAKHISKLEKQPIDMKIKEGKIVLLFSNEIQILDLDGKLTHTKSLDYDASAIDVSDKFIVIADEKSYKVTIYSHDFSTLNESITLRGKPTCISISNDEQYMACGDVQGKILLFNLKDFTLITSRWAFHTSRINSIDWSQDNKYCLTASLDTNIYVYSVEKPSKNIKFLNAHKEGVNAVQWLEENKFVSAGQDSCIKYWTVNHS